MHYSETFSLRELLQILIEVLDITRVVMGFSSARQVFIGTLVSGEDLNLLEWFCYG